MISKTHPMGEFFIIYRIHKLFLKKVLTNANIGYNIIIEISTRPLRVLTKDKAVKKIC